MFKYTCTSMHLITVHHTHFVSNCIKLHHIISFAAETTIMQSYSTNFNAQLCEIR